MAGVVASAGAVFHWMSLKIQRGSSETKRNLEKTVKGVDDHRLTSTSAASFSLVTGPAPVAAARHRVFWEY
jgi:hypothetical protein